MMCDQNMLSKMDFVSVGSENDGYLTSTWNGMVPEQQLYEDFKG